MACSIEKIAMKVSCVERTVYFYTTAYSDISLSVMENSYWFYLEHLFVLLPKVPNSHSYFIDTRCSKTEAFYMTFHHPLMTCRNVSADNTESSYCIEHQRN